MNSSKKVYKNLAFTIVAALVLVAATFAWFVSDSKRSNVDKVDINVPSKDYVVSFYQAIDTNHDNRIDVAIEPYERISGKASMDITDMTPGKKNFYKIEVQANKPASFSLVLSNIKAKTKEGSTITADNLYDTIKIGVNCITPPGVTIIPSPRSSGSLKEYILDWSKTPTIPTTGLLSAALVPTFTLEDGKVMTILYEVGLDGTANSLHMTNGFQGSSMNIEKIEFIVTSK